MAPPCPSNDTPSPRDHPEGEGLELLPLPAAPQEEEASTNSKPNVPTEEFPTHHQCHAHVTPCGWFQLLAYSIAVYLCIYLPVTHTYDSEEWVRVPLNSSATVLLPGYTLSSIRDDPASPQSRAWKWLSSTTNEEGEWKVQELFAFATLDYALTEEELATSVDICGWSNHGIRLDCDEEGRPSVLSIDTSSRMDIPPELELFRALQILHLKHCNLPTTLSHLTNLQSLAMVDCDLSGASPSALGQLTDLTSLTLDGWSGPILPNDYANLHALQTLSITSATTLAGSIPPKLLPQLCNLTRLELEVEGLTGSIPSQVGLLTPLMALVLSHTQLTGIIPTQLGRLTNLQELDLSHNQLSGDIPTELGLLSLEQVHLEGNEWDTNTFIVPKDLCGIFYKNNRSIQDDCGLGGS